MAKFKGTYVRNEWPILINEVHGTINVGHNTPKPDLNLQATRMLVQLDATLGGQAWSGQLKRDF